MDSTKSRFKAAMLVIGWLAFGGMGICCGGYAWMVWAIGEADRKYWEQHPKEEPLRLNKDDFEIAHPSRGSGLFGDGE